MDEELDELCGSAFGTHDNDAPRDEELADRFNGLAKGLVELAGRSHGLKEPEELPVDAIGTDADDEELVDGVNVLAGGLAEVCASFRAFLFDVEEV